MNPPTETYLMLVAIMRQQELTADKREKIEIAEWLKKAIQDSKKIPAVRLD